MKPGNIIADELDAWLDSCRNRGQIARNTIAVGIVVLDHLIKQCPLRRAAVLSGRGEIRGARGTAFRNTLQRYGISYEKFLKEITTRQAHQDGQRLLDRLEWGNKLKAISEPQRQAMVRDAIAVLVRAANTWMQRQHLKISCDQQRSPVAWIGFILDAAKGRSGGKVEQHLVGAKLEARHPEVPIPNYPGHAGDVQTNRHGDFTVGSTCYHVTVNPGSEVVDKCATNLGSRLHPVLLVPRQQTEKARHIAEDRGIADRVTIIAIEEFIALNIIEMATGEQQRFLSTLADILERYNRRLESVETDMSLKIEIQ